MNDRTNDPLTPIASTPKAPRVTPEQVEQAIIAQTFTVLPDKRTTVCQLTLDNGFTVEGTSACVSPENFDEYLGNKYSRERAFNEAWKMLGFRLADQLMKGRRSHRERMVDEYAELVTKITALGAFLDSALFASLPERERSLLVQQHGVMQTYRDILFQRLEGA